MTVGGTSTPTFFLPGAGGDAAFWRPMADVLGLTTPVLFSWPGLGNQTHCDGVQSIDDLVELVETRVTGPANVVAQSMGGLVAVHLALRKPEVIRRMVLFATSAGVDMAQFGAADWRPDYRETYPDAATWIEEVSVDLSDSLSGLGIPILLVWGDCDPISPVSVGKHLESMLPNANLHVVPGGDHDLGLTHARALAPRILAHLKGD